MNEPQLKRPYGSFVNKCTYNINYESCKVLSPELELWGKRNAVHSTSDIFDTLCSAENKKLTLFFEKRDKREEEKVKNSICLLF